MGDRDDDAGVAAVRAAGARPGDRRGRTWRAEDDGRCSRLLRAARPAAGRGRLLLAIDQFEELFTLTDDAIAARFLRDMTAAVKAAEPCMTVALTLRADFYDRPLLHRDFAALMTSSVINVLPMAAEELEAAVLDPARHVGVDVDPALRAELVADTADRLGALPLMQYALTELFEPEDGLGASRCRTTDMREACARCCRAAPRSASCALDDDQQQVALQVFLRLVNPSEDARPSRRRTPLRELTGLDIDPVALSTVLEEFGRHRLAVLRPRPGQPATPWSRSRTRRCCGGGNDSPAGPTRTGTISLASGRWRPRPTSGSPPGATPTT